MYFVDFDMFLSLYLKLISTKGLILSKDLFKPLSVFRSWIEIR